MSLYRTPIFSSLDLLGRIPGVEFAIPTEVEREMREGRGRRFSDAFSSALNRAVLRVEEAKGYALSRSTSDAATNTGSTRASRPEWRWLPVPGGRPGPSRLSLDRRSFAHE